VPICARAVVLGGIRPLSVFSLRLRQERQWRSLNQNIGGANLPIETIYYIDHREISLSTYN
jgi:hypothetical protein